MITDEEKNIAMKKIVTTYNRKYYKMNDAQREFFEQGFEECFEWMREKQTTAEVEEKKELPCADGCHNCGFHYVNHVACNAPIACQGGKAWTPEQPDAVVEDEKEALIKAFAEVQKCFEGREWLMQGRGCYTFDDDKYKEEVRYIMDEFNAITTNLWRQIKSKSFDYKDAIIKSDEAREYWLKQSDAVVKTAERYKKLIIEANSLFRQVFKYYYLNDKDASSEQWNGIIHDFEEYVSQKQPQIDWGKLFVKFNNFYNFLVDKESAEAKFEVFEWFKQQLQKG
ncbi:MAG: hypothetical protein WC254_07360 [Candidatus Woesearchaeota archaeon]|jgi:hypothetical protein